MLPLGNGGEAQLFARFVSPTHSKSHVENS